LIKYTLLICNKLAFFVWCIKHVWIINLFAAYTTSGSRDKCLCISLHKLFFIENDKIKIGCNRGLIIKDEGSNEYIIMFYLFFDKHYNVLIKHILK
jgi:hypothetical protein